ncbi:Tat pathway signal protein [Paenibacillus sp. MMS20-IR301]|uniref:Tat pathway signal protein n=1 Tax=Paenibacillus sp. MMS20-IR301 TaxID=2895946 RepID=UPI0028E254E4|nr:Tat pathway signal protein [Paenibacillus sp. MMS20-IR301]WNS42534.1 Tat pathway signal protein [Paenibacillus sp. MMS20-IR301]
MGAIRAVYHIARADYLERIRHYSFMVILGITVLAAYYFVPPAEAGYTVLYLDGYRGIYNSAWIGGSVAVSTTLLLSLLGFYLVKNSIRRDEITGVGQIIAASSVKKLYYLLGKSISNFAVLSSIVGAVMAASLIMQQVRGEDSSVQFWPLVSPFLFLALPILFVVAALAVWFETCRLLRGTLGNVLYFILYLLFTAGSSVIAVGPKLIISAMQKELLTHLPESSGSYGMGILILEEPLRLFEWQGVNWTRALVSQQLLLLPLALLLIAAAAFKFHGFREGDAAVRKNLNTDKEQSATDNNEIELDSFGGNPVSGVCISTLPAVDGKYSFPALVHAEWRLMMKSASRGWAIIAGSLFILCLAVPASVSAEWLIWPAVWIWPLTFWSGMGSRETCYQTEYLVASSPRYVYRQLTAVWLSGVMLAGISGGGMILRMILEGDAEHLLYTASAVILIPSLALACGVLTRTGRTFEVIYLIIWYLGPFSKLPYIDFLSIGTAGGEAAPGVLSYIMISIAMLFVAYMFRRRLDQG